MARPRNAIPTEPHNVRLHLYLYEIVKQQAAGQGMTVPRYLTGLIQKEMGEYPDFEKYPIHPLASLYLPTRENSEQSASPTFKLYLREGVFQRISERAALEGISPVTVRTSLILDGLERQGIEV